MNTKKIRTPIAAILLIISLILSWLFSNTGNTGLNTFGTLSLLATAFVCVILLAKKYDNLLVIALGVQALVSLALLVSSRFNILYLVELLTAVLILGLALVNCDQTLLKLDLGKYKGQINKFFFIPAILSAITVVLNYRRLLEKSYLHTFFNIANFYDPLWKLFAGKLLSSVLDTVAMLLLAAWLKDPYKKEAPRQATDGGSNAASCEEAYCSLGKHILLCLFTCGIWSLIWTYRTTRFLNKAPNAQWYNPTTKLLLCMFVPFYQIYWFYKHGQRIDAMSKEKQLNTSDMATLCLILGIFIPIVACILMQDKINALCTAKDPIPEEKNEVSNTDEIKKYKELLDQGVITEEEFAAKKKQLLDL